MKNLLITALLLTTMAASAQDTFEISGNLSGLKGDKKIVLSYVDSQGKNKRDTGKLDGNTFRLTGTTAFANRAYLELISAVKDTGKRRTAPDYVSFYLGKGKYEITGADSIRTAKVSGGQAQKDFLAYSALMDPKKAAYDDIAKRFMKARSAKDSVTMKAISAEAKPIMADMEAALDEFIFKHPDADITAELIYGNKMMVIDPATFDKYYKALSPRVLDSFTGRKITEKYNKAKEIAIGKSVDFTLPDAEGKIFTLSSLKGKYVLVDFWASWCVPCRAENPHLLKAYGQLKDKNFEIVSVSLDDKKANWLNAVKADKLPWLQVSDVKGFNTDVAVRFGITAIPQNFLIDPQGKIVGKDLRGPDVEAKISALLK